MEGMEFPHGYISMFSVSLSTLATPVHVSPTSRASDGSPLPSPMVPGLELQCVSNQCGPLTPELSARQLPDDLPLTSETPVFDMEALWVWLQKGDADERRTDAVLRIGWYVCVVMGSYSAPAGVERRYLDLRGLGLKELPPLPVGTAYLDDSNGRLKHWYPMSERHADIYREIGYANLSVYSALAPTKEREKLANALAENWRDNSRRCDRVGVAADGQTVKAWDSRYPKEGVQARVRLKSVLTT